MFNLFLKLKEVFVTDSAVLRASMLYPSLDSFSLRSVITRHQWKMICRAIYSRAQQKCEVCKCQGDKHPIECHELWRFDKKTGVQKLVGFKGLCPECHATQHVGRSIRYGLLDKVMLQLVKVNGWTEQQAADDISRALHSCGRGDKTKWKLDISYTDLFLQQTKRVNIMVCDQSVSDELGV